MKDPYAFKPTPVPPVASRGAKETPPQAQPAQAEFRGVQRADDSGKLLTSLRQAAITAVRNEVPVGQADMRSW